MNLLNSPIRTMWATERAFTRMDTIMSREISFPGRSVTAQITNIFLERLCDLHRRSVNIVIPIHHFLSITLYLSKTKL